MRERGLKSLYFYMSNKKGLVAPLAGAWIEIIESAKNLVKICESLPLRERGLKLQARSL